MTFIISKCFLDGSEKGAILGDVRVMGIVPFLSK